MPQQKLLPNLKDICLENICINLPTYWAINAAQIQQILEGPKFPLYYISPFEALTDESIDTLVKKLYENNSLNKHLLVLLLHNRIRRLDFSFMKKKGFLNTSICYSIGNNCYVRIISQKFKKFKNFNSSFN